MKKTIILLELERSCAFSVLNNGVFTVPVDEKYQTYVMLLELEQRCVLLVSKLRSH